jgi:hypothetical protein
MQTRVLAVLIAVLAAFAGTALGGAAGARAAGDSGGGDCGASGYPVGYDVSCHDDGGSTGSPGNPGTVTDPGGGGGVPNTPCALYPIPGNPTHMLQVCPLPNPNGGLRYAVNRPGGRSTVVPIGPGNGGGPPVTPRELLAWARSKLALPLPAVRTAPPHGSDGLVGLPEWFWVEPGQWHPVSARVQAGGAWAQVTARPGKLDVQPGTGTSLACPGPGTPYNPHLTANAQHTSCSYTFTESSDGLAGSAYPVRVTVVWTASWQGSGGAGGALPPLGRTAAFGLPVAEAQALNPGS